MGDVHPTGNPHYTPIPAWRPIITANILEGLARVCAPAPRDASSSNRAEFLARLDQAMPALVGRPRALQGRQGVEYHNDVVYFLTRFGLVQAGPIEERPGIPPTPGHLARLIQQMKEEKVKVVVVEPWSDQKLAERVAQEAGAKVVVLAASVGAVKEPKRTSTPSTTTCGRAGPRAALRASPHGRRPPRADVGAVPDVPGPHGHPRLPRLPRHRAGGGLRRHRARPDRRARGHRGVPVGFELDTWESYVGGLGVHDPRRAGARAHAKPRRGESRRRR